MGMNQLIYGGINTADYGIGISGGGTYSAPQRDVKRYEVPGRNGDLIVDNGRYKNVTVTYPAFLAREFVNRIDDFRSALMAKTGYQRIEDTYHPDEYRMGMIAKNFDPETVGAYNNSGTFDLSFYCKPQRFLKSGDQAMQFLPPWFEATSMTSQYISVYGREDVQIEAHCLAADTLTLTIDTYDSSKSLVNTYTSTIRDGMGAGQTFSQNEAFYRITVSGISEPDETWFRIKGVADLNGNPLRYNAVMARTWKLTNPTGYVSKPLIEVYGYALPHMTITNAVDGGEDYYVFHSDELTTLHFWMNCELQYMYDANKNNLTDKLYLTDAESAIGEGLVFPEFGEGEIELYMYYMYSSLESWTGIGLVNIYPRWWRL